MCGLPIARLAPSPTGSLHVGNVRTFLWAWLSARKQNARIVLRIEDLEKTARPGVLEQLLSDLRWLGLDWDDGPVWGADQEAAFRNGHTVKLDERGSNGPYVQSRRRAYYASLFERLRREDRIYPCVCTRAELASIQSAPHEGEQEPCYPGTCRNRFASIEEAARHAAPGKSPVWRFRTPQGAVTFNDLVAGTVSVDVQQTVGDFVVFKNPEQPAYQLAVVADDIAMGVTEIVRGDDLIPSTARQLLLYRALNGTPPCYGHAPLVVGPDGKRLAKRHGDARIDTLRKRGVPAEHLIGCLARWSGLRVGGSVKAPELLPFWDWSHLPKDRIVLTPERLGELERV